MKKNKQLTLVFIAMLQLLFGNIFGQGNGGGGRPGGGNFQAGGDGTSGVVRGKIVDKKTQKPLEYVTVAIFSAKDSTLVTGNVSNEEGRVFIRKIPFGTYYIKVNYIGYQTFIKSNIVLSKEKPFGRLGMVTLETSAINLDEISVTAQASFSENSIDRKSYNVAKMVVTQGSTASEVLDIIPSVNVDIDGNISLRGSQNVTVLIDGKPSGLTGDNISSLFESLPASMIEKIEVVTNPSAKYDPDGMVGIINIITKKDNKINGTHGNISLNYGFGGYHSASAMVGVKKGKWNFTANTSFNYRSAFRNGTTFRESVTTEPENGIVTRETLNQDNEGDMLFSGGMLRFNGGYAINKKNRISFGLMYNINDFNRENSLLNLEKEFGSLTSDSSYRRNTDFSGGMFISNYNFGYTHDFAKKGHKIAFSGRYSRFDGLFKGDFEETIKAPILIDIFSLQQNSTTDVINNANTVQADYSLPLSTESLFEAGYKSIFKNKKSDFIYNQRPDLDSPFENDPNLSNDFKYDEGVHSIYATYKNKWGKLGYQAGLRLEQAITDALLINTGESFRNEYFSAFPTLHLSLDLGQKQSLKASYSRRINRPRGRMVNPFTDYSDTKNIRKGNPFLLPEYINSYEVGYEKNSDKTSFSASIYYKDINNLITRIKTVDDQNNSVASFENLNSAENIGLEVVFNYQIAKWWSINTSANAFRIKLNGTNSESELNADGYSMTSKLLSSITLSSEKNVKMQISVNYNSPKVLAQGEISQIYFATFAINKKVLKKKGAISVKIIDAFNTREYNFITSGETTTTRFLQDSYRKRRTRFLQIGFSYSFGKFNNRKGGGRRGQGGGDSGSGAEID